MNYAAKPRGYRTLIRAKFVKSSENPTISTDVGRSDRSRVSDRETDAHVNAGQVFGGQHFGINVWQSHVPRPGYRELGN